MNPSWNMSNLCSNPSSNSLTEEYWQLESSFKVTGQVTAAFMLFFIAVGLPWNFTVVITVLRKRLYRQPTIMLLLNLVVTDILMLLTRLSIIAVTGFAGEYIFGSTDKMRCQLCSTGIIPVCLVMNSLFVVTLMSIDRFLFIYTPLEYERRATPLKSLVAIAVIAMLSIAIGTSSLTTRETISFNQLSLSCSLDHKKYWFLILLIIVSCISLAVITVCNIWVIYIVQKNIKKVYKFRKLLHNKDKQESQSWDLNEILKKKCHKKQLHLFRVFGSLLLSNTIAWVPMILVEIMRVYGTTIPFTIYSSVHILFLSQVVVHPILETFLISDVREPAKEMVTCCLLKKENALAITDEHTYFCCRHAGESRDTKNKCFLLKLIDVVLLSQASNITSPTTASDHNGQTDHGPADNDKIL